MILDMAEMGIEKNKSSWVDKNLIRGFEVLFSGGSLLHYISSVWDIFFFSDSIPVVGN